MLQIAASLEPSLQAPHQLLAEVAPAAAPSPQTTVPPPRPAPLLRVAAPPGAQLPETNLDGLLSGRWRIVELTRNGTSIGAVLTPGTGGPGIALSPKERRVLERLIQGRCQKEIACDVQVAVTTVSAQVRSALDKLGLACWEQAVVVAALLAAESARDEQVEDAPTAGAPERVSVRAELRGGVLGSLSSAEREVALLIVDGLSNSEIATRRHTSPRTVANQVASAFHKLGVQRRLELVRLLSGAPGEQGGPPRCESDMIRKVWPKNPSGGSPANGISTADS